MNRLGRALGILAAAAALQAAPGAPAQVPGGAPAVRAALSFQVSVCLADVEYSIACRERSSLEAARRLEEIFVAAYMKGRISGSLRVWFPLPISTGGQLDFLRAAETRAIEAALRKMSAAELPAPPGADAATVAELQQKRADALRRWRLDAVLEARRATNWSHDWASRSHSWRPGAAVDRLIRGGGDRDGG